MGARTPVRVFISYTHDSESHRSAVLRLGERLRADGVDARLDRWVPGTPQQGWPAWMEDELEAADFVLVICSEVYYDRYRGRGATAIGRGGRFESNLIRDQLYADRSRVRRFVPVLGEAATEYHVPDPLRYSVTRYLLSDDGYDALYRYLTAQPAKPLPPLHPTRRLPQSAVDSVDPLGRSALLSAYLRTLINRLGADRWPADPRLGGPILRMGQHQVDLPARDVKRGRLVTAAEASRFRRLIVLGGPGAGKTWFAARAAIACAQDALHAITRGEDPHSVVLPVFVTVAALRDQAPCQIRDRLVAATLSSLGDAPNGALARTITSHEHVLVFLDSLDEAPGSDELLPLVDACEWSVVLTSRPAAWRHQLQVGNAVDEAELTLEPLSYPRDVRHFVHAWFGDAGEAPGERLLDRIAASPGLKEASRVPLLLAFFCLLGHDEVDDNPDVLLDRTINRLLHGPWKRGRPDETLGIDRMHGVLRHWAWNATGFTSHQVGVTPWSDVLEVEPTEHDIVATDLVALANVVPIVGPPAFDRSTQRRRFVHRALQEYLVASAITTRLACEAAAIIRAHLWAADDWSEVLPAVVRRHPNRIDLCAELLAGAPFTDLPPDSLPIVDFDGTLDRLLLTVAASIDPGQASSTITAHVHAARLRLLASIAQTLHYGGLPSPGLRDRANSGWRGLDQTVEWGIGDDADLSALADRLIPRGGSGLQNRSDLPIAILGLTGSQRRTLRDLYLTRLDDDDGGFGRLLAALVAVSQTPTEQNDLLARLTAAWPDARGWRRDEIAEAYSALPNHDAARLRAMLVQAMDHDVSSGSRVSWGLVERLRSDSDPAEFTAWTTAARDAPPSAATLARAALDSTPTDKQRSTIIEALSTSLQLCCSDKWMDDQTHHSIEEHRLASEICNSLVVAVRTSEHATRVAQVLGGVVGDASSSHEAFHGAADAVRALSQQFPLEVAEVGVAVRARLREHRQWESLVHHTLAARDPLSAEDATDALLASGESAPRMVTELGPRLPEFWAEVKSLSVDALDSLDNASAQQMWRVESALLAASTLAKQGQIVEPIVAAAIRVLTRVRAQPTNAFRFRSMCQIALGHKMSNSGIMVTPASAATEHRRAIGHASTNSPLARQVYEVVASRMVHHPDDRNSLISILTSECRQLGTVPETMVPTLDRLKAQGGEIREWICSRYEFLDCSTDGERQEFLDLLSRHSDILDVHAVREITSLPWPEAMQEIIWKSILTRFASDDGKWWDKRHLAETLSTWTRTASQRAQLADCLGEILFRLANDNAALGHGRGYVNEAELPPPESTMETNLGMFVTVVRGRGLPAPTIRAASEALVKRASTAATQKECAILLECAGALLPHQDKTVADTERAMALLHEARTEDEGVRNQRALGQFRPTAGHLLAVTAWPAPPSHDLLKVVRQSSSASDWYSLLQEFTERGLLAATYQSHLENEN
ncbi:MAG: NACHT domain-containing protein [Nocardioides sp.]